MILHIAQQSQWEQAQATGLYEAASLTTEGFIHCSFSEQVIRVANAVFSNQHGLILLLINPQQVRSEIRSEVADGDEFPHLYGPLNTDAVVEVFPFEPGDEGSFELPDALIDRLSQTDRS
jgi:uncharacterized protein (DUF952 family)